MTVVTGLIITQATNTMTLAGIKNVDCHKSSSMPTHHGLYVLAEIGKNKINE